LRLSADLATWGVWRTGVLDLPVCPDVLGADFLTALGDFTAVVGWATLALRLGFWLTVAWAFWEIGVDLASKGLALGEGCSTINKE
jgi:hypothetical protein